MIAFTESARQEHPEYQARRFTFDRQEMELELPIKLQLLGKQGLVVFAARARRHFTMRNRLR